MLTKDDLHKAFTYIEPGPVVLVTTKDGRKNNICTISWTMVMDFTEHCHIALTTGAWNHTFTTMMKTKECCICIPSADMAKTVVGIGTTSGEDIAKFKHFGLTPVKGETVKAPLIKECIACLECKVLDYVEQYDLVVLECEELWVDKKREFKPTLHANGDGTFRVDSDKIINLRKEMGQWVPEGSERF